MKKLLYILSALLVGAIFFSSCDDATEDLYGDYAGEGTTYAVFTESAQVVEMSHDFEEDQIVNLGVKLFGPLLQKDVTVSIAYADGNTAIEGTHFDVASNSLSIAAGEVSTSTDLVVHGANFEKGDTVKVVLMLESADLETSAFASKNVVTLIRKPLCPFDLNKFTGGKVCNERGYGDYDVSFSEDSEVANRIWNNNFWDWPADGALLYYDLSGDDNATVTVPEQEWTDAGGDTYLITGQGTYDPCLGTMVVDYVMKDKGTGAVIDEPHHEFR